MRPSAKGLTFLHLIPPWLLASLFWPPTDETSKEPNIIPDTFLWKPLAGITHSKWMCACNLCFQTLFLSLGPSPRELLWPAPSYPPIHCSLFRHSATRPALLSVLPPPLPSFAISHQGKENISCDSIWCVMDTQWDVSICVFTYLKGAIPCWQEQYERTDFLPSSLKWSCLFFFFFLMFWRENSSDVTCFSLAAVSRHQPLY